MVASEELNLEPSCSLQPRTLADPSIEEIRRIPDLIRDVALTVIVPREHRNGFDHAARSVGVKLIEVETG